VEGAEAPAECTSDADCATAGCSGEVCTTVAEAAGVMSTCEVKPCFSILDRCGCVDGRCSWSIKAAAPPPVQRPISLPPK
jgi:eight-cysteine-cluster-containing protein